MTMLLVTTTHGWGNNIFCAAPHCCRGLPRVRPPMRSLFGIEAIRWCGLTRGKTLQLTGLRSKSLYNQLSADVDPTTPSPMSTLATDMPLRLDASETASLRSFPNFSFLISIINIFNYCPEMSRNRCRFKPKGDTVTLYI